MAYTTIDLPTDHFNTKLWTGDGNTTQAISGVGHQPDLVWLKNRNLSSSSNIFFDSVRGTNKALVGNNSNAEASVSGYLNSFDSDGFTVGNDGAVNGSGDTYVSWNWLAGGSASSNSNGSITSSVSANTTAGFSIVSWDGSDANATIGHGLGSAPRAILIKNRESAEQWYLYHESMGNGNRLVLNDTTAKSSAADWWQDTSPTSSVFYVSGVDGINGPHEMIAYCFAEKKGYSKFGSYTGNGNANGTFVYTGFKPAWVLAKRTNSTSGWILFDNKREPFNLADTSIRMDDNGPENESNGALDLLSNGFKWITTDSGVNGSGDTYIYLAFAEAPFVSSKGIPTTAR